MSYFYLIEVDPHSPLDKDIELDLARCILDPKSGYRDYYRVTADSVTEAVDRILINNRLLAMSNSVFDRCSVCKRRLVWIDELGDYIPLVSRNCRRDNCPFVNDLEADEKTNYNPDNYKE